MVRTGAFILIVAAGVSAGCGARQRSSRAAEQQRGRAIYVRACAGCHTLAGRESGAVGGDLALVHLGVGDLASFARAMPARRPLSPGAADAVASYIDSVARQLRRRNR